MQRIIPPRNKQHIIRCDCRTTCVLREVLEVLGHAFCALVSTALLYVMGVKFISPVCAHTISVSAPINWGVAFTPRRSVSASTILPMENQRAALRRYGRVSAVLVAWIFGLLNAQAQLLTSRVSSSILSAIVDRGVCWERG